MESLQTALHCMKPNIYMGSVDLKDAFYSIPVFGPHQKYLKFEFEGKFFKYTCMPMGYGPSMRVFTKTLKPPFSKLRENLFESSVYVDDNLLFGDSRTDCQNNINTTVHFLQHLGFTIHAKKSILTPVQKITYLGFILDSRNMTITLTDEKKSKIIDLCMDVLHQPVVTIRKVATVIGNLVAAFPAMPYGRLFYRQLETVKICSLKSNKGNFDKLTSISEEAKNELLWWVENTHTSFNYITTPPVDIIIHTDASNIGWGIHALNISNGGKWQENEKHLHINALELRAIEFGVKAFCKDHKYKHVKVMCDNATAIAYINNMGGTKSKSCNKIAKDIWVWCHKRSVWVTAAFIPGVENTEADKASRVFHNNTEWMLNTNVFQSIITKFGCPNIDLFASMNNKQVEKFVSWKPDPHAIAIDAFTIPWVNDFYYIFPPFSLIGRTLAKITSERTKCIMVAPYWTTQPWFPALMKLASETVILGPQEDLLVMPTETGLYHPLAERLSLIVANII